MLCTSAPSYILLCLGAWRSMFNRQTLFAGAPSEDFEFSVCPDRCCYNWIVMHALCQGLEDAASCLTKYSKCLQYRTQHLKQCRKRLDKNSLSSIKIVTHSKLLKFILWAYLCKILICMKLRVFNTLESSWCLQISKEYQLGLTHAYKCGDRWEGLAGAGTKASATCSFATPTSEDCAPSLLQKPSTPVKWKPSWRTSSAQIIAVSAREGAKELNLAGPTVYWKSLSLFPDLTPKRRSWRQFWHTSRCTIWVLLSVSGIEALLTLAAFPMKEVAEDLST